LREHREIIDALGLALDALTVRVEACEQGKGVCEVVTALKVDIIKLRCDMDELKSIDFSIFFNIVELPEVSSTNVPASSEIHPANTTGDVARVDDDAELEADTDEEELGV